MMKNIVFVFLLTPLALLGGGISGMVRNQRDEPLRYATLYIAPINQVMSTSDDGRFLIELKPGEYEITVQYIGHTTIKKTVRIANDVVTLDFILQEEAIQLNEVTVRAQAEDPAYNIMRNAIAYARYRSVLIDSLSSLVYLKGKGKLSKIPALFRNQMKKDDVIKDRVYLNETVLRYQYKRPSKVKETVIAVKQSVGEETVSPLEFIGASLYSSQIGNTVSPLSPKAFSVYNFEWQGITKEGDEWINKITVTPKSKADHVFQGVLYIVENKWCIHSADVVTESDGISFRMEELHKPYDEKIWLPVSKKIKINGAVFGFQFSAEYFASLTHSFLQYNAESNAFEPAKWITDDSKKSEVQRTLAKKIKRYKKQEDKQAKEKGLTTDYDVEMDSIQVKKDSSYWNSIRPVALSRDEKSGYAYADSVKTVKLKKSKHDSLLVLHPHRFKISHALSGHAYPISRTFTFQIKRMNINFNTVEGFNLNQTWRLDFHYDAKVNPNRRRWIVEPTFRYAFSRQLFSGKIKTEYVQEHHQLSLEGGRYVFQFNENNPILPMLNTLSSLLLRDNWMKLYEQRFAELRYTYQPNFRHAFSFGALLAKRAELYNQSDYSVFSKEKTYTANAPVVEEMNSSSMGTNEIFKWSVEYTISPWKKFYYYKRKKYPVKNSSPTFTIGYQGALPSLYGDVRYDLLRASAQHRFRIYPTNAWDVYAQAGKYFNFSSRGKTMFLPDYKNFNGNQLIFQQESFQSFRLLPYYEFSTQYTYGELHQQYSMQKLLVARINKLRKMGYSEMLGMHTLWKTGKPVYTELSYGIDGIFRVLSVESVVSFWGQHYQSFGIRIGLKKQLAFSL